MTGAREWRIALLVAVALCVIGLDRLTKWLAVRDLANHPVNLIGPVGFRLQYNSGIAFSIGSGLTLPIVLVAVVLVVAVAWFGRRVPTPSAAVAVGLVLGGAVGNLLDRVFGGHHGSVVDFVYTRYWPTFNVADASIVCGAALLAWLLLRARPERGAQIGSERTDAGSLSGERTLDRDG
ncbi:MAG: signal peptidase II [Acidimicrobiales bacterium]